MRDFHLFCRIAWVASGLLLLGFLVAPLTGLAATYYNFQQYQGNGVPGGIGDGYLQMSNNSTTVRVKISRGTGSFTDKLVFFIDTTPGGLTTTSGLQEKSTPLETAVSGNGISRSVANFAPGFGADYAIALGVDTPASVYRLVDDASGPHLELVRSGITVQNYGVPNAASFAFQFDWVDIGLPNANTNFFKFETSYIKNSGSRTLQSYEGLTGLEGFNTITFTNYDTYGVPPVPEYTNAALAIFGTLVMSVSLAKRARRNVRSGTSAESHR